MIVHSVVNGATILRKHSVSLQYRAQALLAGFCSGVFITLADASRAGFALVDENGPDWFADFAASHVGIRHAEYSVERFAQVARIPHESAFFVRAANVDAIEAIHEHRERVARFAARQTAMRDSLIRQHPLAALLLAQTEDSEAVETVAAIHKAGGDAVKVWRLACRACKAAGLHTL